VRNIILGTGTLELIYMPFAQLVQEACKLIRFDPLLRDPRGVDLVGVGYGGLILREVVQSQLCGTLNVHSLVTIGAPHHPTSQYPEKFPSLKRAKENLADIIATVNRADESRLARFAALRKVRLIANLGDLSLAPPHAAILADSPDSLPAPLESLAGSLAPKTLLSKLEASPWWADNRWGLQKRSHSGELDVQVADCDPARWFLFANWREATAQGLRLNGDQFFSETERASCLWLFKAVLRAVDGKWESVDKEERAISAQLKILAEEMDTKNEL
jgi:hypothetical protein